MGAHWIVMDEAGFDTGFVLSFGSEAEFIEAVPRESAYHTKPDQERKKLLKAVYKAAKIEAAKK